MNALIYTTHVKDLKHNLEFDKFKISYQGYTFDVVWGKPVKERFIKEVEEAKLKYPVDIELQDDIDYNTKPKKYTRNDGTTGTKTIVYINNYQSIKQGKFASKSLDEIVATYREALGDADID